jgi:hypothetical protein
MAFDKLWGFFTYIFRIFKLNRQPEYTIVNDIDDQEYGRLEEENYPQHSFFCNIKL